MIYFLDLVVDLAIFAILPLILKCYHLSPETYTMAKRIIVYHGCVSFIFWPLSFSVPNIFRAANDVQFTMWVSIATMWLCRIGLSYVIGKYMGLGVFGTWIAMSIDWIVRGCIFMYRYLSRKWIQYAGKTLNT